MEAARLVSRLLGPRVPSEPQALSSSERAAARALVAQLLDGRYLPPRSAASRSPQLDTARWRHRYGSPAEDSTPPGTQRPRESPTVASGASTMSIGVDGASRLSEARTPLERYDGSPMSLSMRSPAADEARGRHAARSPPPSDRMLVSPAAGTQGSEPVGGDSSRGRARWGRRASSAAASHGSPPATAASASSRAATRSKSPPPPFGSSAPRFLFDSHSHRPASSSRHRKFTLVSPMLDSPELDSPPAASPPRHKPLRQMALLELLPPPPAATRDGEEAALARLLAREEAAGGGVLSDSAAGEAADLAAALLRHPPRGGGAAGTLLVCAAAHVGRWEARLARARVPFATHRGKARVSGARVGGVVLTTYGMLAAKEGGVPRLDADGWRTRGGAQSEAERTPRSQLHQYHWRRLVLADALCVANPRTQRAAAALALRADVRWALLPRDADEALVAHLFVEEKSP